MGELKETSETIDCLSKENCDLRHEVKDVGKKAAIDKETMKSGNSIGI